MLGSRQAELLQQINNIEREGAKKRSGRPTHQDIPVDFFRRADEFARQIR